VLARSAGRARPALLRAMRRPVTGGPWKRSHECPWQRQGARGFKPWQPSQLYALHPKGEWVGCFKRTAKSLERRRRSEIDGNLLGVALDRAPVRDLDVEAWQTCGRPGGFRAGAPLSVVSYELGHPLSPSGTECVGVHWL
jgi:hypothetical protein